MDSVIRQKSFEFALAIIELYQKLQERHEYVISRQVLRSGTSIGANVEVSWQGKWYAAKILNAQAGRHLVHYAGYDDGWDEWVNDNRIRPH